MNARTKLAIEAFNRKCQLFTGKIDLWQLVKIVHFNQLDLWYIHAN